MATYDDSFYCYTTTLARQAAAVVCPLLYERLQPQSVLDVGCAQGAWLAQWQALGAAVQGIDFPGAAADGLLVPADCFTATDLSEGFALDRRFDLTQCLEVAEHLPAERAAGFVASLAQTADIVLFSAAPPGQGGDNHVNEQPYDYWRDQWRNAGYTAHDWIRPLLSGNDQVAPWYRYNMLLFANAAGRERLPADIRATAVPDDSPVPDVAPPLYRLRRIAVRCIPPAVQTRIARLRYSGRRQTGAGR